MTTHMGAVTLIDGFLTSKEALVVIARSDEHPERYRFLFRVNQEWHYFAEVFELDFKSLTFVGDDQNAWYLLGESGKVVQLKGNAVTIEQIPDVSGAINTIKTIDEELVVCGAQRQVYQRSGGTWISIADEILTNTAASTFNDIDGIDQEKVAVGCGGEIFLYDGQCWHQDDSPTDVTLTSVRCVGPKEVWIAGDNGVVLRGYFGHWEVIKNEDLCLTWSCIEAFEGKIYLANQTTLARVDGNSISAVDTGWTVTTHTLHAKKGTLYSIGRKHILAFDGESWSQVPLPEFTTSPTQQELITWVGQIDSLNYLHQYRKDDDDFEERLKNAVEKNEQRVRQINELLRGGVGLNFESNVGNKTPLHLAVIKNNVELVKLLIEYGADSGESFLEYHAAEAGADRVIKYFIEERNLNPRETSMLAIARSSRWGGKVVPMLTEILRKTKDQRPPLRGKPKELTEENVFLALEDISPKHLHKKLDTIVDAIFVEERSISIKQFYSMLAEQAQFNPDLVFACIGLVQKAATSKPKDKVLKTGPKEYAHYGNLTIKGNMNVSGVFITGDLTIEGDLKNLEGASLFVGGNFRCKKMITEGPTIIGGSLIAEEINAGSYNDYCLKVLDCIEVDRLTVDGHSVTAKTIVANEIIEKGTSRITVSGTDSN